MEVKLVLLLLERYWLTEWLVTVVVSGAPTTAKAIKIAQDFMARERERDTLKKGFI